MKQIKNNKIGLNVTSNKDGFIFDSFMNNNKSPYLEVVDEVIVLAIFIESTKFVDETIYIEGWSYGYPLSIKNLKSCDYILKRFEREDVAKELRVKSVDAGFSLQFNIKNGQTVNAEIGDLNIEFSFDTNKLKKKEKKIDFEPSSDELLIVGGAPSIALHLDRIKKYKGEIWALNDAIFWLENNDVSVNRLVISDQRFVHKNKDIISNIQCKGIISADYIDFEPLSEELFNNTRIKVLGRNGISENINEAFHGCTVANFALQVARLSCFKAINTVGVLLHFPTIYERIDGSKSMPEFVHDTQIINIKSVVQKIRKSGIALEAFEYNSNINFF
jgi:hypothetical protein